jgi:Bacterial Ig-like domain (group 3)/IPT/TIG domain
MEDSVIRLTSGRYFPLTKVLLPLIAILLVCCTAASPQTVQKGAIVIKEFKHDTGPILREIAPLLPEFAPPSEHEIENNVNPNHKWSALVQTDPVFQTPENTPSGQTPSPDLTFDGGGIGDGAFFCNCMPPDNDGAVGTTQYVQFINLEYRVFDKSGNSVLGPLAGNHFWSGFGGSCQSDNSGDPIVRFDAAAQRWVVSQFAINGSGSDYECVAVSQTDDATGAYNRYAFSFNNFPDYPKLSVWPDAYYFTFNIFNTAGTAYIGADVCAADRSKMLTGAAATMQCFQQSSSHYGMLPSDLDGATPPAAGTPNFVMELNSTTLDMFKFHVDFVTPANSTFTGPTTIPVAAFTPLCPNPPYSRGRCVQQPTNGSDLLEALGDRLMWRLVYRNFGDHTTLLTTHSIVAGSSGGIRWYEIRNPETSPTIFQSGTFAPDSQYRWMPAIAMDQNQDIAVGYSVSGTAAGQYPSIAYAGRVPSDATGTLEPETVMTTGLGSQTGGYDRWGDYSSLTVDPVDDCTFWFAEEYLKTTGGFNWSTRIGNFKFPTCAQGPPNVTGLSVNYGPVGTAVTITGTNFGSTRGDSTVTFNGTAATSYSSWSSTSIATTVPAGATTGDVVVTVGGTASNAVAFTVSVTPTVDVTITSPIVYGTDLSGMNAAAEYQGTPVTGTFAYTATKQGGTPVAVTKATVLAAGSYTLTANFTPDPSYNNTYSSATGTVSLTVNKATPNVALISSVNPVFAKNSITFTATVSSSVSTPTGTVTFKDGTTSLGSAVTLSSGVATLATSSLAAGSHSITAVYNGDSNFSALTSSAVSETVQDFTLSVTGSSSQTVPKGGTATYNLQIAPTNGTTFPAAVTLALSGAPKGSTVTVTPQSVSAGDGTTPITVTVQLPTSAPVRGMGLVVLQLSPFLAGMLLPLRRIRRAGGKQRRGILLGLLLLVAMAFLGIVGCGGGSSSSTQTTPPGPPTYKMTLTGTANTLSHGTTLTLIVQ